jgi:hypothetical protein
LARRLDGGSDELRGLRVDDNAPAEQHVADDLPGVSGGVLRVGGCQQRHPGGVVLTEQANGRPSYGIVCSSAVRTSRVAFHIMNSSRRVPATAVTPCSQWTEDLTPAIMSLASASPSDH